MYTFLLSEGLPVEESELRKLEKSFKVSFPKILRELWLKHNGARTQEMHLIIEGDEFDVVRFLDVDMLKMLLNEAKTHGELIEYIPFAEDWGGDLFCWKVDDGGVYILYPDSDVPIMLTESIEQFFTMMEEHVQTESMFSTIRKDADELLKEIIGKD